VVFPYTCTNLPDVSFIWNFVNQEMKGGIGYV